MAWWKLAATGLVAGVIATAATGLYQAVAAKPFGQDGGGEPSNEQAADAASGLITGAPVPGEAKKAAGELVHYATGVALGLGYVFAATRAPAVKAGFGIPFGLGVALALDDLLVPAFGWGEWPMQTDAATHAYSLSTHVVFGAALEGTRRAVLAVLD